MSAARARCFCTKRTGNAARCEGAHGRWLPESYFVADSIGAGSTRGKNLFVNLPDSAAEFRDGVAKGFRRGEPAADGDPVERLWIGGQRRFAFKAPAPQNPFDAAELAITLDQ